MADDDLCELCQQSRYWHLKHKPQHQFVGPEDERTLKTEPTEPVTVSRAGDPVLRLALVHAGVITEEDLSEAQRWIDAARDNASALVLLPDEDGRMQYHLMDLNEAMRAKAAMG